MQEADMIQSEQIPEHSMMEMLAVEPLGVRIRRILDGLKMPKDSGEYKYARFMILRIFGPSTISFIVMTLILIGSFFIKAGGGGMPPPPEFEITMMTPETVEQKIEVEEDKPKEEVPPPEEVITENPDLAPGPPSPIETPGPPQEFSSNPDPSPNDNTAGVGGDMDTPLVPYAVVMTKSPVVIKGLYGNRTKGGRESALRAYGGGGGGGKFPSEVCVLRALRWLKQKQESDGSWNDIKPALTGLALLAYLAHGETPSSEEFGLTVEMAIRWLLDNCKDNGHFNGSDGNEYSQPIAAYALSEAYALTKVPDVKAAAEKAVYAIVEGQHASGGWNYKLNKEDRDDTSYMGWCAQALKAAHMAKLDVPGLEEAMKKGIDGFKKNYGGTYEKGVFGYTATSGYPGLTAVGVLCMQYLGAGNSDQVKGGLAYMNEENWLKYDLDDPGLKEQSLYYWYYATQAKFNAGGETWNKWNKIFSPELMKKQKVLKKEESNYIDHKGRPQETGFWDQYKGYGSPVSHPSSKEHIFGTLLCVLQLEVYYRFLPTYKSSDSAEAKNNEQKKPVPAEKKKDDSLNINI